MTDEPMYPTMAMIEFELATVLSMESTLPYVVCRVLDILDEREIVTMQLNPTEAVEIGTWFIEAAEAATDESITVVSMRALKISEETILAVLEHKRMIRLMIEEAKQ